MGIYRNKVCKSYKKTMKILIYTNEFPPSIGGAGACCYEMANGLKSVGINVTILAPSYNIEEDRKIDKNLKFKVIRKPLLGYFRRNLINLIIVLIRERPHKIIIAEDYAQMQAAMIWKVIRFLKIKYFVYVHGSEILKNEYRKQRNINDKYSKKYEEFLENSHGIMVNSNSTKSLFKKYLSGLLEKVKVIKYGITPDLFPLLDKKKKKKIINGLNIKEKSIILTSSSLNIEKGHDVLFEAFKKVLEKESDVRLLVAGKGRDEKKIKKIARDLSIDKKITFLGMVKRNKLYKYYNICSFFIMLSRRGAKESFGLVFIEANACKKAVIGGRTGGVPEAIRDNYSGLLVGCLNVEDAARKMLMLLENKKYAEELGRNGYKRYLKKFTHVKFAERVLDFISP